MAKAPAKTKKKAVAADDLDTEKVFTFNVRSYFDDVIDAIEKKTKVSSRSMNVRGDRLSTGLLALDMYLLGGLVPGSWTTIAGGEQSCKSTTTMTIIAQLIKSQVACVTSVWDFEGSSDANYVVNMLKTQGVTADPATIFGVVDPDDESKWLIPPAVRYYAPDNGEAFFDYMAQQRLRLPDKIIDEKGIPWLIFENTKENKKIVGSHYDAKWFSKRNQFKVRASDSGMQTLALVDSYPAMLPDQADTDDGSAAMALQARMFSDGIKRFKGGMRRKMMTILGVNQIREKPATMFGSPEYEPGGSALKFYCFARETPLVTRDHGTCTAPEIEQLITAGELVHVETAHGFEPVMKAWRVDEKKIPHLIDANGYQYTGSETHRQLVLEQRQTKDDFTTFDMHWRTLEKLVGQPVVAVLRMPTEEPQQLASNHWDLLAESKNRITTSEQVLELGRYGSVSVVSTHIECDAPEEIHAALNAAGYFAQITGGAGVVTIPGVNTDYDDIVRKGALSKHQRNAQRSAVWDTFLAPVFPDLISYCSHTGCEVMDTDAVNDSLNRLIAGETSDTISDLFYDQYDGINRQLAYVEEYFSFCDNPWPANATVQPVDYDVELWDVTVPSNSTVITDRLVSHNSDVRIRLKSRAVPQGWDRMKDRGGSVSEASFDIEGGSDIYRFISARTIKNKMGGIPDQETWMRLWESDGNGEARGFDPVFDTYHFLHTLGLTQGTRKKIKFRAPCPMAGGSAISWEQFKVLILGSKSQITEICKKADMKSGDLRAWCFKYLASDKGKQAVKDSIAKSIKVVASDDDD